ncbi:atrial natriuretic peptide-converting enzyme-like [Liolophura sinensis]|uniref:atrial natriuretic peptide-converting enzyme-like n=1 Tax=Liolophura sinensis TaxID=3198878 RepID=UPI0031594CA8
MAVLAGECEPVQMTHCINITTYNFTTFPNYLGMQNQVDAANEAGGYKYHEIWTSDCYAYDLEFLVHFIYASLYVFAECSPAYSMDYNDVINCFDLPDSDDPTVCFQNPYQPGKPQVLETKPCKRMGYNVTAFPNLAGQIAEPIALEMVNMIQGIQAATRCYRYSGLFACAVYLPPYSGNQTVPYHVIPPCRSLCEEYRYQCEFFLEIFESPLPENLSCSQLPQSNDTNICIGAKESREPPPVLPCPAGNITCDKNRCIPRDWICDGYQDCRDNSDEKYCALCPADKTKCPPPSSQCIEVTSQCDGRKDCYGGLDELQCVKLEGRVRPGLAQAFNPESKKWEPICSSNWNVSFSELLCKQLGYRKVLVSTYKFSDVFQSAVVDELSTSHPGNLVQQFLKRRSYCPSGMAVYIKCGDIECGERPAYVPSPLRVVGGREVRPGAWPWVVSLHGGPSQNFFCGASLIDEEWVMTAAHCVGGKQTSGGWTLKVGHTRRRSYSQYRLIRHADRIIIHPNFSPYTVDNDIALIHLNEPVQFNDFVRPICLAPKGYIPPLGTRCVAAGWGKHNFKAQVYSRAINQVELEIVNWEYCREALKHADPKPPHNLTRNMMCAGGGLDHDSCSGDSGGPFVCRQNGTADKWFAAGIVSWGVLCATPNVPGVYTTLPNYADWISDVIANHTKSVT